MRRHLCLFLVVDIFHEPMFGLGPRRGDNLGMAYSLDSGMSQRAKLLAVTGV